MKYSTFCLQLSPYSSNMLRYFFYLALAVPLFMLYSPPSFRQLCAPTYILYRNLDFHLFTLGLLLYTSPALPPGGTATKVYFQVLPPPILQYKSFA